MTTVISELGNKWWPLPPEKFLTAASAPDMWFADELPPTLQDEMRNPAVTQMKTMLRYQIVQQLMQNEQRRTIENQVRRYAQARSHVGKRVKASRH
jgi:cell envelope opacity-associated protein A